MQKEDSNWRHVHARETYFRLPKRLDVPDSRVSWDVQWPEYEDSVNLWSLDHDPVPNECGKNHDPVPDECDKNPYGRTGLGGRGVLPRYGPNRAAEPVITRSVMLNGGKQTQVLVCKEFRAGTPFFSLPGGLTQADEVNAMMPKSRRVDEFLMHLLNEYKGRKENAGPKSAQLADNTSSTTELRAAAHERLNEELEKCKEMLKTVLESGIQVYPNDRYPRGYSDDPRNTDHAWVEAAVYHFHIPGAASGGHDFFEITADNSNFEVKNSRGETVPVEFSWLNVDKGSATFRKLHASHEFYVDLCLPQCTCGRTQFDRQDGSHCCFCYVPGPREQARRILREENVDCKNFTPFEKNRIKLEKATIEKHASLLRPGASAHSKEKTQPRSGHTPLPASGRHELCHLVITRLNPSNHKSQVLLCKVSNEYRLPTDAWATAEDLKSMPKDPRKLLRYFLSSAMPINEELIERIVSSVVDVDSNELGKDERGLSSEASVIPRITDRRVFPDGKLYKNGYFDDPRNTDDAWMETEVHHLHLPPAYGDGLDAPGTAASKMDARQLLFEWVDVARTRLLSEDASVFYGSLSFFVEMCVPDCMCGSPQLDAIHREMAIDGTAPPSTEESGLEAKSRFKLFKALKPWGQMQFEGRSAVAKFVRASVENDRDAVAVCRALFGGPRPQMGSPELWAWDNGRQFWRPKAVISVTGSAQNLELTPDMRQSVFHEGILRAAVGMNALIVDGGMSTGVMQEVGEAIAGENRVAALGVCPWGAVLGRNYLEFQEQGGQTSVQSDGPMCTYRNSDDYPNSSWGARLDPNHQFFAFVDSGEHGGIKAFGKEIGGRVHIERELTRSCGGQDEVDKGFVPHVVVVVNGGFNSIQTVHSLSRQVEPNRVGDDHTKRENDEDRIPVVVVEGTGRAADMLASCWRHLHDGEFRMCSEGIKRRCCLSSVRPFAANEQETETVQCPFLRAEYLRWFEGSRIDEDSLAKVVSVCRKKEQVAVYSCCQPTSLCYAIMKSVCMSRRYHGGKGEPLSALKKLLEWKEVESEAAALAKEELLEVMSDGKDAGSRLLPDADSDSYYDMWKAAIKTNNHNFVSLLHDTGTVFNVWKRKWKTDDPSQRSCIDTKREARIVDEWSDMIYHGEDVYSLVHRYMGWPRWAQCGPKAHSRAASLREQQSSDQFQMVEEMFLWSVLQGRGELAEVYWRKGHPSSTHLCISSALFACALSRTVSKSLIFRGSARDRDRLGLLAARFEAIAAEVLGECAQSSPAQAVLALSVPYFQPWIPLECAWLDSNGEFLNPIKMAYVSKAVSVVELDAFQEGLDRLWYGRLVGDLTRESAELFRGTLVQLGVGVPGMLEGLVKVLSGVLSVFGTFAVDGSLILVCAVFPPLVPLLKGEGFEAGPLVGADRAVHKLCAFYTAPCTKFVLAFWSYLVFVLIYTYVGFFMGHDYSVPELVMHAWILSLYVAELRQCQCQGVRMWISNGSNVLDMMMLAVYVPAFAMRVCELLDDAETYGRLGGWSSKVGAYLPLESNVSASYQHVGEDIGTARYPCPRLLFRLRSLPALFDERRGDARTCRSLHGVAGIFFWIRVFYFLRVSSTLGPLWVVLVRVVCKDVVFFLVFLFVFLISFGAAIICSTRPAHEPGMALSAYVVNMLYFPYMEIYGEHNLESSVGYFSSYPGGPTESDNRVLGTLLLCVYLLVSSIVLINLLIARERPSRH